MLGLLWVLVLVPMGAVHVLVPLPVLGFVWLEVDAVPMWACNMVLVVVAVLCMVPVVGGIVVATSNGAASALFFEHNVVYTRPEH